MPVPDFQSFILPVINCVADGSERSSGQLRDSIAGSLQLSPEDLSQKLASGVQTVYANRVAWAAVYLQKAGAIERVKRGVFRITERGRELLSRHKARITVKDLSMFPEFVAFHKGKSETNGREGGEDKSETPEEQLADAYKVLRESLATDLLESVKKAPPTFFEELVVELLVAMGYGGSVEDAGKAVGGAGDGGIDGIIKEDKLGLDVVYLQAKRWSNPVGRPVVQAFAGSLEGFRARKGVLITTSWFSQDAREYVQRIEKRIVLIDGKELAQLMIDHNIGVSVIQTYEIKRIDAAYFED